MPATRDLRHSKTVPIISLACALLALGSQKSGSHPMTFEDQVGPALAAAGLTTETARFDPGMMALLRSAEFTTPLYQAASMNSWQAPLLFNIFTDEVDAQAGK